MKQQKRTFGLLPVVTSTHRYRVGKVNFHVVSHFTGKATMEEKLAGLMLEEVRENKTKNDLKIVK